MSANDLSLVNVLGRDRASTGGGSVLRGNVARIGGIPQVDLSGRWSNKAVAVSGFPASFGAAAVD